MEQIKNFPITDTTWQCQNFNIPMKAKATNTQFRWIQDNHSGPGYDNWAIDNVEIKCSGNNVDFQWSPNFFITEDTIPDPKAFPTITKDFSVEVNNNGCISNDTVNIKVFEMDVTASKDTSICEGDSVQLSANSNISGADFNWNPDSSLSCDSCSSPISYPVNNTSYIVIASKNNCKNDSDSISVSVSPLPLANAGQDTSLCKNDSIQLDASGNGDFNWYPSSVFVNDTIEDPIAIPEESIKTILEVTSNEGCTNSDTAFLNTIALSTSIESHTDTVCPGDSIDFTGVADITELNDNFDSGIDSSNWSEIKSGGVNQDCGSVSGEALHFDGS
ncbi:MAG: hypothetical protein ABEH43_01325, partial [Flavobacteriales bacterium]